MRFLRYNTATIVTVGPFIDKTDGVTLETALTISNERISFTVDLNDGSAPTLVLDNVTGATSGTSNDLNYITNCDAALMQLELSAANTSYYGCAMLVITDAANHCPVFHEFTILPALVYDSLIAGADNLQVDTIQVTGTAQTARDLGTSVLLSSGTGTGQVSLSSGAVTVGTNNDKTGYSLTSTTGLGNQTANITGNLSGSVGSVTGAVGSVTGNVSGSVASVASGGISAASFSAGAIDAAAIAANAIGASELATDATEEIADALLNRNVAGSSNSGRLVKEALYALRNKVVVNSGTMTVYSTDDATSAWTASVTGTAGADPITTIDPA